MQELSTDNAAQLNVDNQVIACHDCDLLMHDHRGEPNRKASCPRCGAILHITKINSVDRTLALSLTGLLLFIPANILPLLTLEVLGQANSSTIVNGVLQMFAEGYWWMSVLVAFCSIIAPLCKLLMLFYLSLSLKLKNVTPQYIMSLKLYQWLDEWGMFDVYMLGLLVSFIKLKDLGNLDPGPGLWCFIGLMFIATASSSVFDKHAAWSAVNVDTGKGRLA